MASKTLVQKLLIKPGCKALILNAPDGYMKLLEPLPKGVKVMTESGGEAEFCQLFAFNSDELNRTLPVALEALKPGGLLWMTYPKKSSGIETDLARDDSWAIASRVGFRPVAQVSVDDTWSAVRFREVEHKTAEELVEAQFSGKRAALRPIYDRILEAVGEFGPEMKVAPRKSYVALRRKQQFAIVKASTNTRVDVGLRLPGHIPDSRLLPAGSFGSGSITHKVALADVDGVDDELAGWLEAAFRAAG